MGVIQSGWPWFWPSLLWGSGQATSPLRASVFSSALFQLVLRVPGSRLLPCPRVGEWGPKLEGTLAVDPTRSPGKVGGTFCTAEGQPRLLGSMESLQESENVHTKRPSCPKAPPPWGEGIGSYRGERTSPLNKQTYKQTNLSTAGLLNHLTKHPLDTNHSALPTSPLHRQENGRFKPFQHHTPNRQGCSQSPETLSPAPDTPRAQSSLLGKPPTLPSLNSPASGSLLQGGVGSGTRHRPACLLQN